ncbi:unnamed protein product [Pleuronectes platessa]|uniref:Uncharacterized protein n=1 Tax=Pleuronectes platessa TaxID=8262 RepID=A0A9N7TGL4_PLEPL|nr:unnamed protein product [Pleuronectes platessa]
MTAISPDDALVFHAVRVALEENISLTDGGGADVTPTEPLSAEWPRPTSPSGGAGLSHVKSSVQSAPRSYQAMLARVNTCDAGQEEMNTINSCSHTEAEGIICITKYLPTAE